MEKERNKLLFEELKKAISQTFLQDYSTSNPLISEWKGIEIVYFQEHLLKKVKANVSEKWFYTYFKSDFDKLPRIDMLNLLAQYVGYKSWSDFCEKNQSVVNQNINQDNQKISVTNANLSKEEIEDISFIKKYKLKNILYSLIVVTILFSIYYFITNYNRYEFIFFDADKKSFIKDKLWISVLDGKGEVLENQSGKVVIKSSEDTINLVVNSVFYKKDTFIINLKLANKSEEILLEPDIYTQLLYYYSKSYTKNIVQNRAKLNALIDNNALIYQSFDNEFFGYETMTKEQYIDFLSIPTNSLKNFEITKSVERKGKIVELRFKINTNEK